MDQIPDAMILLIGVLIGLIAGYLMTRAVSSSLRAQANDLQQRLDRSNEELTKVRESRASIAAAAEVEKNSFVAQLQLLEDAKNELSKAFEALSSRALRANSSSFFEVANAKINDLMVPFSETLKNVQAYMREIEGKRESAYGEVRNYLETMQQAQKELRIETSGLVRALRSPGVRGRWGEIQLKRVIELAGMVSHCDFQEQQTLSTSTGSVRPDVIVNLPSGRCVVVDAKVPLEAYLDAIEAKDEDIRLQKLRLHARQVRNHINALSSRAYYQAIQPAPEFVVLFLPSEVFYSAALEQDPSLIEHGAESGVLVSTPTTLIALLKAIAYGWNQEKLAENAQAVSDLGKELHERLVTACEHLEKLGRMINSTVDAYNKAVGSLESRVLVSARRLKELGAASEGDDIPELPQIDRIPRRVELPLSDAPELEEFPSFSTEEVETKAE